LELRPAQFSSFIKAPDKNLRIFLVYGPDEGLVRERAKQLSLTVLETLDDPFCYAEIEAGNLDGDPARLRDEIEAISMMGGERVVRLRSAGNVHAKLIQSVLDADFSNTLLVIEAGDIKKTTALVKSITGLSNGAAVACYHDKAQDVGSLIQDVLGEAGLTAASDATDYLRKNLGSDRSISRQELIKLTLYMGATGATVTLEDAKAVIGDSSAESVFDVVDAALLGNLPGLEASLNKAFFAGESAITFLRLIQGQLKQLHKAASFAETGVPLGVALKKAAIPPFNQKKAEAQIGRRGGRHFAQCLDIILKAELDCKTTGSPAETLCRRALLRVCMANRNR